MAKHMIISSLLILCLFSSFTNDAQSKERNHLIGLKRVDVQVFVNFQGNENEITQLKPTDLKDEILKSFEETLTKEGIFDRTSGAMLSMTILIQKTYNDDCSAHLDMEVYEPALLKRNPKDDALATIWRNSRMVLDQEKTISNEIKKYAMYSLGSFIKDFRGANPKKG